MSPDEADSLRMQPGAGWQASARTVPFAPGSVSLRLYPYNELRAPAIITELCTEAALGLDTGFDGVMTSEHHGGFAGYLAQPLQMSSFVLSESPVGWAAAAPLVLPLRATALVAEEVAWLRARHPGRVGVGVAAGALPLDFAVARVNQDHAVESFKAELPRLVAMLRGQELGDLEGDPALLACREDPVPVLSAAVSPAAARRAARCGAGILLEGMSTPRRLAAVTAAFDEAGGTGSKVLIRRVWLGRRPPSELVDRQRTVYESYAGTRFGDDQTVVAEDPVEMAARLEASVRESGADALNLRLQLPGMTPDEVRTQIERIGTEVLPALRAIWPAERATVP